MFNFKRIFLLAVFALFGSSFFGARSLANPPDPASNSLSPKIGTPLRVLLREAKQSKGKGATTFQTFSQKHSQYALRESLSGQTLIGIFLKSKNVARTKSAVMAAGGRVSTIAGDILVARLPLDSIESLARQASISVIEASQKQQLLLDSSRLAIHADAVHAGKGGLEKSYEGKNVIVGVLDSGIDEEHPDFKTSLGSRVLFLWDMSQYSNPPSDYLYGTEYTQTQINAGQCKQTDDDGHGTHVAGIAAGNGRAESGLIGVAPKANIIFVKGYRRGEGFYSDDVIDGCAYIFKRAKELNKSAVINLSLGGDIGPHDGSSAYEQAISNLVGEGKIIVAAAGNSGDDFIHLNYDTGGSNFNEARETQFEILPGSNIAVIDLWYDTGDINVGIAAYKNGIRVDYTPSVAPGGILSSETLGNGAENFGTVMIDARQTSYPENGSKRVYIRIKKTDVDDVTWSLYTYGSGKFDAWVVDGRFSEESGGLRRPGDNDKSLGIPSTAKKVICVGSYTTKNKWTGYDGKVYSYTKPPTIDEISSFSSLGPSRDGRNKPDITAPGQIILSALSSDLAIGNDVNPVYVSPSGKMQVLQGTSMSAPQVTGAIALMLEKNPQANYDTVMKVLTQTARQDHYTGSVPNNTWGYGKLDLLKAMLKLTAGETDTTSNSEDDDANTDVNALKSSYPNPVFSSRGYVTISYKIPENCSIPAPYYLKIYDVLGREMASYPVNADEEAAYVSINGLASGMYFYRITGFSDMKKFIVLKNE